MSPSPVVPDLSGLVAQVKRVADALYTDTPNRWGLDGTGKASIADLAADTGATVASVVTPDSAGKPRVNTDPNAPA